VNGISIDDLVNAEPQVLLTLVWEIVKAQPLFLVWACLIFVILTDEPDNQDQESPHTASSTYPGG